MLSWGTTKTGKRREIPLSRFLRYGLVEHLAGKAPDDLVFPAPQGGYLRNGNFRRGCFDQAVATVGVKGLVPRAQAHGGIAGHQIRSQHQGRPDHDGPRLRTMTWDLYGHLYDDDLDNVAERLVTARSEFLQTSCVQSVSEAGNVVTLG